MSGKGITLLGLGPGDPYLLTRQAWHILESVPEIYLRTRQHGTVAVFPPELEVYSFDHLYEDGESFERVYERVVEQVLQLGRRPEGVVYGVPGHPFVAEATSPEIARRAREEGLALQIVDGISFLEPTFSSLGVDPLPQTVIVDALDLAMAHHPSFPPDSPALIAQIYSPQIASDVKLTLMSLYPDEHPVHLVHAAGTAQVHVEDLPLFEIDRSSHVWMLTTLYVPALGPATSFEAFQEIIAHLRAPEGCPWDREQTHQSLRRNLLEEAYEVLAALDRDDPEAMREEFGDLLLQIVLHAQIASEYGEFTMSDILKSIHTKIVNRHPHVFGDLRLEGAEAVVLNWEKIKAAEREENEEPATGLLDGVALSLPALAQAEEYQARVARVGFDWPNLQGVLDKIEEELVEVQEAPNSEGRADEIGDLLFTVVNLARWYEVDAESALRGANNRFRERFSQLEKNARARERELADMSLDEMDDLWEAAKG